MRLLPCPVSWNMSNLSHHVGSHVGGTPHDTNLRRSRFMYGRCLMTPWTIVKCPGARRILRVPTSVAPDLRLSRCCGQALRQTDT